MKSDPIAVLESVYDLRCPEPEWVARVVESARPALDQGMGVQGWTYTLGPSGQDVRTSRMIGAPADLDGRLLAIMNRGRHIPAFQAHLLRAYANGSVGTLRGAHPMHPSVAALFESLATDLGACDILRVSITDLEGFGMGIGALVPLGTKPRVDGKPTLARIATHLRTAMRARMRTVDAEAVLEADGRVVHCEEGASARATRSALREAARAIDRARGGLRARDPEGAVALWRGLVEGTWTLVDQHESDGRRYVIARRNEPRSPASLPGLGREETICLLFAAMGHSQKLLAYELDLSEPHVSRLLKRAMRQLGIPSRSELAGWFAGMVAASARPPDR